MAIYMLLITGLGIVSCVRAKNRRAAVAVYSASSIILIQWLRNFSVGVDLQTSYIPAYEIVKNHSIEQAEKLFGFERGYLYYSQILARLGVSEQLFLGITAAVIIIPISYIWYKNSSVPAMSVFIYITFIFFIFSFSGLRQAVAFSITFFSYKFIQERRPVMFILLLLLAYSFHNSAIAFAPAYLFYKIKFSASHYITLIAVFAVTYIFRGSLFSFADRLFYEGNRDIEDTGAYTTLLVMIFLIAVSLLIENREKNNAADKLRYASRKFSGIPTEQKFNTLSVYQNYIIVGAFFQIFATISPFAARSAFYYSIFLTLMIPEIITQFNDFGIRLAAGGAGMTVLFMLYLRSLNSGYLNVSPYLFYWQ
jgi:hypothetical protein